MNYVVRQGRRIEIETIEAGVAAPKTRRRQPNSFAKVPLDWATAAARATRTPQAMVWIMLHHMAWQTGCTAFPLSNAVLAKYGVNREVKRRALKALEASGLIQVERRHGRAPVVTLVSA
jgi:hypothetical protein